MVDNKLSKSTLRMIKKYGENLCLKALHSNEIVGNGTIGISHDLRVHHNTANALCNAGREIVDHNPDMWDELKEFSRFRKTRVLTHDYSVVEGGVTNWEQNADILIMSLEHCKDLGRKKFAREEIRRMGRIIDAYKEFNLKTPE